MKDTNQKLKNLNIQTEFTSVEFAEQLGLKVNTLHYYVQAGAITPDIDPGSGTGTRRLFSLINYFEAAIITHLLQLGIPKRGIVAMLKSIKDAGDRERINPIRFFDPTGRRPREFLLFFKKDNGYSHRFLSHEKGDKRLRKRSEWKKLKDVTSVDEKESIQDYLSTQPVCIVLDLDSLMPKFWFHRLLHDFTETESNDGDG